MSKIYLKYFNKDNYFKFLLAGIFFSILFLFINGMFESRFVPDTNSYIIEPGTKFEDLWGNARNPFFGLILKIFYTNDGQYTFYPLFSLMVYFFSIIILYQVQKYYGLSSKAALSIPLGLLISNPLILYGNYLHPEVLALSFLILSLSLLISLAKLEEKNQIKIIILISFFLSLAYFLKPMFIIFILSMPILFFLISKKKKNIINLSSILFIIIIIPFLIISSIRLLTVNSFNIASFGGFQMSAIGAIILDDNNIDKLSSEFKEDAFFIQNQKKELIIKKQVLPIPFNSSNQRSFFSTAIGYYDIFARNYDTILGEIMIKLKKSNELWVLYDQRMQNLTFEIINNNKLHYLAWIIGGSIRFIGRLFVSNLSFMLSFLILSSLLLYKNFILYKKKNKNDYLKYLKSKEINFIIIFSSFFALSIGLMSIMFAFPASRYIDSAGIMLAGIPIYIIILIFSKFNYKRKNVKFF